MALDARIEVRVPKEQADWLRERADREMISPPVILRRLIRDAMEKEGAA